jgi:hypothetical protein
MLTMLTLCFLYADFYFLTYWLSGICSKCSLFLLFLKKEKIYISIREYIYIGKKSKHFDCHKIVVYLSKSNTIK